MRGYKAIKYGLFCLLLPLSLLGAVLIGVNTPPVKRLIAQKLPQWTGGMVSVGDVSGILPWHLSVSHIVLQDPQGTWLEADKADMRLGLLGLLHKQIHIRSLSAEWLRYARNPAFPPSPAPVTSSSTSLPDWAVRVDYIAVSKLEVGAPVVGTPARLQAQGRASLESLTVFSQALSFAHMPKAQLELTATRLDEPAHAYINLHLGRDKMMGRVHYDEAGQGFVTTLGQLPVMDPLVTDINMEGPYHNVHMQLSLHAGKEAADPAVKAELQGSLDLLRRTSDLAFNLHTAALTIRPAIGWEGLDVAGNIDGPFLSPLGTAKLDITDLTANGIGMGHAHIQFEGSNHDQTPPSIVPKGADSLHLSARLDGVSLPGKASTILARSPILLDSIMRPTQTGRPFQINLNHEESRLVMVGHWADVLSGHVQLDMPHLPNLTALVGQKVQGTVHVGSDITVPLHTVGDMHVAADGHMAVTEGPPQLLALIGHDGALQLDVTRHPDGSMVLQQARVGGHAVQLHATALLNAHQQLTSEASLILPDLAAASPRLRGRARLDLKADGALNDFHLHAGLSSMLGVVHPSATLPIAPMDMTADIAHLPTYPQGTMNLTGTLDRSPVALHAAFDRQSNGTLHFDLLKLGWKSLQGRAAVALLAGYKLPQGNIELRMTQLNDLTHLMGQPVAGHIAIEAHTEAKGGKARDGATQDRLVVMANGQVQTRDYAVGTLQLKGEVEHLLNDPSTLVNMQLSGMRAKNITGGLQVTVRGPQSALAIQSDGAFDHVMGGAAHFNMAALANLTGQTVRLDRLVAGVKGEEARLLAPTTIHYGSTLSFEHLALEARPPHGQAGRLFLHGTLTPQLGFEARLEHVTPALAAPFVPSLQATGDLSATAKLHGTMEAPVGHVTLDGTDLRLLSEATASLPAGVLHTRLDLDGRRAALYAQLQAGAPVALQASGTVPLKPSGDLALAVKGKTDLSIANALLGANGMGVAGQLGAEINIAGTFQHPQVFGVIQLHGGAFDHYVEGVHLNKIEANIAAHGDSLNIEQVTAGAGQGSLALSGQVGVLKPGLPVDLHFTADKAQPIQSDFLTEQIDSKLHIYGQATTRLDVDGNINVPQASITLPDSMPASVPQVEVITPDQVKKPTNNSSLIIGLNIDFTSPEKLFVRGHGLFAEMQGKLHIGGISSAPILTGGINLKRGSFNLAGINLNFTHGKVGFNGASAAHKLDPTVDFRADRNADGTLASLLVTGYASDPKIDFTSTPNLPRDEVLSILLFGANRNSLSPTQLASLGLAVVQIGGGSAFDPLGKIRSTLGLDHLAIGGGSSVGNGAANVEAGKYVMKGVYVGAREGLSGKGAQAQVKVDLTKRLQLNTTVGTGGQVTGFTTPDNDPGSSIGLSYGIDY